MKNKSGGLQLEIAIPKGRTGDAAPVDVKVGESIAVNGVCLTVTQPGAGGSLFFDAVQETLERSTLRDLAVGDSVNVERALCVGDRLGGHFVQGHVDGVGTVAALVPAGDGKVMEVNAPEELARQMILKGSVAVDGVSLTIAELLPHAFKVALIPHTLNSTTLGSFRPGRKVNIETDLIGKWIMKLVKNASSKDSLSVEKLRQLGFD